MLRAGRGRQGNVTSKQGGTLQAWAPEGAEQGSGEDAAPSWKLRMEETPLVSRTPQDKMKETPFPYPQISSLWDSWRAGPAPGVGNKVGPQSWFLPD